MIIRVLVIYLVEIVQDWMIEIYDLLMIGDTYLTIEYVQQCASLAWTLSHSKTVEKVGVPEVIGRPQARIQLLI